MRTPFEHGAGDSVTIPHLKGRGYSGGHARAAIGIAASSKRRTEIRQNSQKLKDSGRFYGVPAVPFSACNIWFRGRKTVGNSPRARHKTVLGAALRQSAPGAQW